MDRIKPRLLILNPTPDTALDAIARGFDLRYAPDATRRAAAIAAEGTGFQALLTRSGRLDLDNLLLTPHTGGVSPEAKRATLERFLENATRPFAGLPVVSPL
jgi:lactate dehydrogenase-like 2-hydroxyacid dehydrogenase